jgi:hypothetical protein
MASLHLVVSMPALVRGLAAHVKTILNGTSICACQALRRSKHNPGKRGPTVVTKRYRALGATDYDVCVAGGTLGVFLALALQVMLPAAVVTPAERHLVLLRAGASGILGDPPGDD